MSRFYDALLGLWDSFRLWFRPRYQAQVVQNDLPGVLVKHRLYIVEESGYRERAALLCPCGCGHILYLNLLADERPCWRITLTAGGLASLHPSVWRKTGCNSHFWLRRGRVHWCK